MYTHKYTSRVATWDEWDSGQVNNAQVGSSVDDESLVKNSANGVGRGRVPQREANRRIMSAPEAEIM